MTGTSFIDVIGVAIVALCGVVFGIAFIAILLTYIAALYSEATGKTATDQRDYSRSPDWPD